MSTIEHDNDAGLAEFLAKLSWANTTEPTTVGCAVIGLTNFGERPAEITRLAEVLGRPVSEAEKLMRRWGAGPARGLRTASSPSTPSARKRLPDASSRSVGAGSG